MTEGTIVDDAPVRLQRAAALPPEERRAAIVDATLPLLLEHGTAVTTRMIAVAAGIAEGTIFRVFPDKDSLIQAVVDKAFDQAPTDAALAEIDLSLPFEERLTMAVVIVQARFSNIWRLIANVGPDKVPSDRRRPPPDIPGLIALFEPDAEHLRHDPVEAARMLRALTLACSHPALILDKPMSAADIVSLMLDGVRRRPDNPTLTIPPTISPTISPTVPPTVRPTIPPTNPPRIPPTNATRKR